MLAAMGNPSAQVIEVLLEAGAEVDATDDRGWSALMWAARATGNPDIVEKLLDRGADPTIRNEADEAAWDYIDENEALEGSEAYWRLNDYRYE